MGYQRAAGHRTFTVTWLEIAATRSSPTSAIGFYAHACVRWAAVRLSRLMKELGEVEAAYERFVDCQGSHKTE
jgi:hypothetical protein